MKWDSLILNVLMLLDLPLMLHPPPFSELPSGSRDVSTYLEEDVAPRAVDDGPQGPRQLNHHPFFT